MMNSFISRSGIWRLAVVGGGCVLLLVAVSVLAISGSSQATATDQGPVVDIPLGDVQDAPTDEFAVLGDASDDDLADLRPEVQELLSSVVDDHSGQLSAIGSSDLAGGASATVASVGELVCAATDGGGPIGGMGATCAPQSAISSGKAYFAQPAPSGEYVHVVGLVDDSVAEVKIVLDDGQTVTSSLSLNVYEADVPPTNGKIIGLDSSGSKVFEINVPFAEFGEMV